MTQEADLWAADVEPQTEGSRAQYGEQRGDANEARFRSMDEGNDCKMPHFVEELLPQLNLPSYLPSMIHQPVALFTIKDPNLLAPPEFMTPRKLYSLWRPSINTSSDLSVIFAFLIYAFFDIRSHCQIHASIDSSAGKACSDAWKIEYNSGSCTNPLKYTWKRRKLVELAKHT